MSSEPLETCKSSEVSLKTEPTLDDGFLSVVSVLVGPEKKHFYILKSIFTKASAYFRNLLQAVAEHDSIALENIETNMFVQIMRFLYGNSIEFNPDNIRAIYLEAKRFEVQKLLDAIENYQEQRVEKDNVFAFLKENQFYGFRKVEQKCLRIIHDDPLFYFDQEEFLSIDRESLKLIVSGKKMNYSHDQLQAVIDNWKQTNDTENVEDLKAGVGVSEYCCKRLIFVGSLKSPNNNNSSWAGYIKFSSECKCHQLNEFFLIGMGLLIKSVKKSFNITITIGEKELISSRITNTVFDTLNTINVFFKPFHLQLNADYRFNVTSVDNVKFYDVYSPQCIHDKIKCTINYSIPFTTLYYKLPE